VAAQQENWSWLGLPLERGGLVLSQTDALFDCFDPIAPYRAVSAKMSSVEAFLGGQRHAVVTDDDHGPILQIVMWFLMVAMILMTLLRLAIRFAAARDFGLDDAICVLAMVSLEETFRVAGDG
jgi:hypothetical protein